MKTLDPELKIHLHEGTVIPAHPLALTSDRKLDEARQRLLTRYYMASGAGGIAIGVHTTQFQIRDPEIRLYRKVLKLAIEEISKAKLDRPFLKVAGVSGPTEQAVNEANICNEVGYDIVLLSSNGLGDWPEEALLERAQKIAEIIPIFGFYLQPAVGGKVLSFEFWKAFAEISNVQAIKMAPFNRYQTLDVVRAVCESSRCEQIALYTGNDDNIVNDLLTTYTFKVNGNLISKNIVGGLLGHWAVWTKTAVEWLETVKEARNASSAISRDLLTLNVAVTDSNAAFFDAANNFRGCIAGIHEVLYRQGILKGIWCLDENEGLSPGQKEEIDRVYHDYPELNDDKFVKSNLEQWMKFGI